MTKPHSYLHITGGIGAALLPFAFPWLSPVYGLIIMALGVLVLVRSISGLLPLLLFAVFIDWQWLSTTWSEHSSAGWGDVDHGFAHHRDGCFDACRATQTTTKAG